MNTHQVQKMPVHTHTHESVSARRGDARNGKKKAKFANAASHTWKEQKKTNRRSYYWIQSQYCFMSLGFFFDTLDSNLIILINIHTYIHNSNLIPRWWDIIYQHAYFLCDLAKFQSPLIQIHYYFTVCVIGTTLTDTNQLYYMTVW